jgi:hypothetical protein
MSLTLETPSRELVDVLALTIQRMAIGGQPWCPTKDAQAIRRMVIDRSEALGTAFGQVVRLARLAALASRHAYFEFLYVSVPLLRGSAFKAALEQARRAGRLQPQMVQLTDTGVMLREAAMAARQGGAHGFDLSYAQMPRLAAFLDVLHNALGYAVVADLLGTLALQSPCLTDAHEVAKDLRNRFNAWLAPRLESDHRRRQCKLMHAFLAERSALRPDKIDDNVIFDFWRSRALHWRTGLRSAATAQQARGIAKAATDEGFRLFSTSVCLLLRYRQALQDARTECAVTGALTLGSDRLAGEISVDALSEQSLALNESWHSPLAQLEQSGGAVKWLTEKERARLANYLGGVAIDSSQAAFHQHSGEDASDMGGGLMDGRPFDLNLVRTLLRVDVFATAQSGIVARLKKGAQPVEATSTVLSKIGDDAYHQARASYHAIRDQIHLEALAAMDILGSAEEPAALLLLVSIGGAAAHAELRNLRDSENANIIELSLWQGAETDDEHDESLPQHLSALRALVRDIFGRKVAVSSDLLQLLDTARKARKRVHREGFRREDSDTQSVRQAMRESLPAVVRLDDELDRLMHALRSGPLMQSAPADRAAFGEVFDALYGTSSARTELT